MNAYELIKSLNFSHWLDGLDNVNKVRILARLARLECGHFGDHHPIGEGISELRLFFGAGYRIYYLQSGKKMIILLCGGDKSSQTKDIQVAKKIALEWESLNEH